MGEPRKIVLILGNGFDLDLGLKTSYKDFWESEFCPKDYPAPLIHHLNQRWEDNMEAVKWYDLENELLNYYTTHCEHLAGDHDFLSEQELDFIRDFRPVDFEYGLYAGYEDLIAKLVLKGVIQYHQENSVHLLSVPYKDDLQQSGSWRDKKALQLIKQGLCNYLKIVNKQSVSDNNIASNVLYAITQAKEKGNEVSIYTFNYTALPNNDNFFYKDIIHYIHGECESGQIIIGTKDSLGYREQYDFLQKSFDPNFNPPAIVADLITADDVIIFGHSIGENDRQYFKTFFKQQVSYESFKPKRITLFTRDDQSELEIKRSLQRMTDGNLSSLYVQIIKTGLVKDNPNSLKEFLLRYIDNEALIDSYIKNLVNKDK